MKPNLTQFAETAVLLAEADGSSAATPKFDMFVIAEGMSKNRVNYGADLLKQHGMKLNGRGLYVDHPVGADKGSPAPRSLSSKGGYWSNVRYVEAQPTSNGPKNGLVGTLNLFSQTASPVPWLEGMIRESLANGHPEAVGISIYASGKMRMARDASGVYKEALTFENFVSADAVAEAGAGGEPISLVASKGLDPDVMELEELTLEQLTTLRPDLVAAAVATKPAPIVEAKPAAAAFDSAAFMEQVTAASAKAAAELAAPAMARLEEATNTLARRETKVMLTTMLENSQLPLAVRQMITTKVADSIMAEAELSTLVNEFAAVATSILTDADSPTRLREGMIVPFREAGQQPNIGGGVSPLDKVVWALEDFFGAGDPEHKGKFGKIWNFKEFYGQVTGDHEVTGFIDESRSVLGRLWHTATFAEALPGSTHVVGGGTITMTGLINTTMNKALVKLYDAQPMWWEPIVDKQPLSDLKQQTRVRLYNFGSLTERTVDGAEYVELDWNSTSETYTPTEYGNVVTIGRRAIINDELKGISRIPALLAQSAAVTINEYISNLFTQNSGNGPTLTDGIQVFNAASHQNNRLTAALSRTSLIAARYVIMKMLNDASKRIGLVPRSLLVPIDLETLAFELTNSTLVPDSANNAPNIFSSPAGLKRVIVVPNWTDVDNWYLMAEVSQIVGIEVGFLYGRETPEMFMQDNPTTGMVFTNDVMTHKIRHDYGADWIDYRGAVGNVV